MQLLLLKTLKLHPINRLSQIKPHRFSERWGFFALPCTTSCVICIPRGRTAGRLRYASAFACFALIRRWRAKLRVIFLPPTGGGLLGVVRGVMWCLSAMEIPPAGAPPGGGVRLRGNGWWSRVIFGGRCRFAQDDTEGSRRVRRKAKCRSN